MTDPLFWLLLSLVLLAVSLLVVMVIATLALRELGRAARAAEQLLQTLERELPSTLEALRLTGVEVTSLTSEVNDGLEQAGHIIQQVDTSLQTVRHQAGRAQRQGRSLMAGVQAAWRILQRPSHPQSVSSSRRSRKPRAAKRSRKRR